MKLLPRLWTAALLVISAAVSLAQGSGTHLQFSAQLDRSDVRAGESAQILVTATIEDGWYTYPIDFEGTGIPLTIELAEGGPFSLNGDVLQPDATLVKDKLGAVVRHFEKEVVFAVPVKIGEGLSGAQTGTVLFTYQACNDTMCDPPVTAEIPVEFTVEGGEARQEFASAITTAPPQTDNYTGGNTLDGEGEAAPGAETAAAGSQTDRALEEAKKKGLLAYMGLAFLLGLAALATPCVWPMIPITVSYFSKRGEEGKKDIAGAAAYSGGIVGTFTVLGVLFAVIFGASSIQKIAANVWVNGFLALLFIVLAMNLFGVFELVVPQRFINKAQEGTKKGGLLGPIAMGLVFTLTSFTCTVPIVGTLLLAASQGDLLYPIVGMLAFSMAFAAPFLLLALFPQWLKSMPKSGGWLNNVKAYMAFLELAAALKFISNIDLVTNWQLIPNEVFIAIWAIIIGIAAIWLLGWLRLPHEDPNAKIGIARRIFAVANIGILFWLMGDLRGANLGQMEGFLPGYSLTVSREHGKVAWIVDDYEGGLEKAKAENKLVFVNFTGYQCTNCRYMEFSVFPSEEVSPLLEEFVAIELYTDNGTELNNKQAKLREELTNSVSNPVYVVMTPEAEIIDIFAGSTNGPAEFRDFLQNAQEKGNAKLLASR